MKNVIIVSYPRSGQHYFENLLKRVTGQDEYCVPNQCRVEGCAGKDLPKGKRFPCPAGRRFQKSHDGTLNMEIRDEFQHLVLFRRPLFSIVSNLELRGVREKGIPLREKGKGVVFHEPSQDAWEKYALQRATQWRRFVLKWVGAGDRENVLPMRYEDIIHSDEHITRVFEFLFDDYDKAALAQAMEEQREKLSSGQQRQRDLSNFKYPLHDALIGDIRKEIGAEALKLTGYDDVM